MFLVRERQVTGRGVGMKIVEDIHMWIDYKYISIGGFEIDTH